MLRSASRWAMDSRNACRIPAPAPCARTYSSRALSGRSNNPDTSPTRTSAEAIIEPLERVDEVGLELEHRAQWIFPQLLHPGRSGLDRELLDVELGRHLAPFERHRYGRARQGPRAERCHQQTPVAVLDVIEIHLAAPLLDLAGDRGDLGQLGRDDPRQQPAERAGLLVCALAA